ncbi:unnamed protein product [Mucor hiemalis]
MTLHYQVQSDFFPVFDDLPGIKNIVRFYRDKLISTEDKMFYDNHITKMFPAFNASNNSVETCSFWCEKECEISTGKCVWRGKPILIMTEEEMISIALSGKLNRLKCLVYERVREKFDIVKRKQMRH